jgi:hypothetical protein
VLLELFAPDGSPLESSSSSTTAFVNTTATVSGTYSVNASEFNRDAAIGYRLDISRVRGANDGGALTSGTPVIDSLLVGEVLAYQFDAAAGDRIVATLADSTNPTSGSTDAYLELYAPDGTLLTSSAGFAAAIANLTVDQSGTFTFLVSEELYDRAIDFRLDFSRVPQVNDGGTLSNGVAVVDSLLVGEVLAYQFDAAAGDRIVATLADNSGAGFSSTVAYLELYAPDGTRLAASEDSSTAFVNLTINQTGRFTLLAAESSYDRAMSFRLDFSRLPQVNDGGNISSGVPVVDSLLLGEVLAYRFDAAAGDRIVATLADNSNPGFSNSSAYLELYGPDGIRLATSNAATTATTDVFAGQAGTFTLLVADGNYDLAMDFRLDLALTPSSEGGSLSNGQSSRNTLLTDEVVAYRFDASAGDRVLASLAETQASSFYSPRLRIAAPDGSFIFDETASSVTAAGLIAPQSGTYLLLASESGFGTGYEYELSLTLGDGSLGGLTLTNGVIATGPLIAGDVLEYQFSAAAGDSIVATLAETGPLLGAAPRLQLFAPSGAAITNPSSLYPSLSSVNHVRLTVSESGMYTLLASEDGLNTSFNFRLDFARMPGANDGGAIVNDIPRTGALANGEVRAYQFQASAGDTISANMQELAATTPFTPILDLYGPNGDLLAFDADNSNARITALLSASGTYTLLVGSGTSTFYLGYGGTGDFSLSLTGATIPDDDGDGVPDLADNCPGVSNSDQQNSDADSLGNACDPDDDNDGLLDSEETSIGTNPLLVDTDGDGFTDGEEVNEFSTDPLDGSSVPNVNSGLPIWLLYEAIK